jgi:hypothetical protein
MTVLGCIVRPDRAVIWSDTETYSHDHRPSGQGAKLALNPMGIAVVGAGSMNLIREAARIVQASATIDQAERRLPTGLRIRAGKLAPEEVRQNPSWCAAQMIIAVGFSPTAGRVVGWRLAGEGFFEPTLVSRFCTPADADLETDLGNIDTMAKIVAFARRQITLLRLRGLPDARGGSLVVAEIAPDSMHCRRIPDFDASRLATSRPPALPSSPVGPQTGSPDARQLYHGERLVQI